VKHVPVNLALALWATLLPSAAGGQTAVIPPADPSLGGPFLTTHPSIRAGLERIGKGSSLWREAADAIRAAGRQVVILPSDQVVVASSPSDRETDRFDPMVLAEVAPVTNPDSSVDLVVVVVNLPLLQEMHRRQDSLPAEFDADLDLILIHEIYGHAVPYLTAGSLSGRCPDPLPSESAAKACSIMRENLIRAELRLGRRIDYGLGGLTLTRRDKR
jgi:hypothetical protein